MNGWAGRIQFGRGSYLDGNEGETWPVRPSISLDWISFFIFQITFVLWIEYQSLSFVYDSSPVVHLRKVSNALKTLFKQCFHSSTSASSKFFLLQNDGYEENSWLVCIACVGSWCMTSLSSYSRQCYKWPTDWQARVPTHPEFHTYLGMNFLKKYFSDDSLLFLAEQQKVFRPHTLISM